MGADELALKAHQLFCQLRREERDLIRHEYTAAYHLVAAWYRGLSRPTFAAVPLLTEYVVILCMLVGSRR